MKMPIIPWKFVMRKTMFALALVLVAGSLAKSFAQTSRWVEVSPPGSKSFVMMPSKPTEKKDATDKSTAYLFTSQMDSTQYLFGWVDYRPGVKLDVQGEINANRDNLLKGVKANLISERKISLDGHPGLEFMAESEGYVLKSRIYVVGSRPYMLAAAWWLKGEQEPPGVATFLYSFRLEK